VPRCREGAKLEAQPIEKGKGREHVPEQPNQVGFVKAELVELDGDEGHPPNPLTAVPVQQGDEPTELAADVAARCTDTDRLIVGGGVVVIVGSAVRRRVDQRHLVEIIDGPRGAGAPGPQFAQARLEILHVHHHLGRRPFGLRVHLALRIVFFFVFLNFVVGIFVLSLHDDPDANEKSKAGSSCCRSMVIPSSKRKGCRQRATKRSSTVGL
jgi:hypothetical protein